MSRSPSTSSARRPSLLSKFPFRSRLSCSRVPIPPPFRVGLRPELTQEPTGTSFTRAEHTTFDLGVRDGAPRVITYVKTSQGFDWNQDIFLPSSSDITIHNGINRPERVVDIVLTEEDCVLPS